MRPSDQQNMQPPQMGIGGQGLQTGMGPGQTPAHMSLGPLNDRQMRELSGLSMVATTATTMNATAAMFTTAMPFAHPFLAAGAREGGKMAMAARGMAFVDPYRRGFGLAGTGYKAIAGNMAGGARFMSTGVSAARVAGGLFAGATGIATLGLTTALTEAALQASMSLYEGAERRVLGADFMGSVAPPGVEYAHHAAAGMGVKGGFLDQAQSVAGTDLAGLKSITNALGSQGSFRGVKDLQGFKKRLMSSLKELKKLSEEADVSLSEANQLIQSMKGMGDQRSNLAKGIMLRSQATGIDAGTLMQVGSMGAQTAFSQGLGRGFGMTLSTNLLGSLSNMYDTGSVNRSYVDALGGKEAVAATLSTKMMSALPTLGMMFTKVDEKGAATIDYEKIMSVQKGDSNLEKEMQKVMNPESMKQVEEQQKRMQAFLDNPALQGQLGNMLPGFIGTLANRDPSSLRNVLGLHQRQIGMLGSMLNNAPAEAQRLADQQTRNLEMAQARKMQQFGQQYGSDMGFTRMFFENSGFNDAFRAMGRGLGAMGSATAGYFSDVFGEKELGGVNVTAGDIETFRNVRRRQVAGEDVQMLGDRQMELRFSKGEVGGYSMSGMLFGGTETALRGDLGADPRMQRFIKKSSGFVAERDLSKGGRQGFTGYFDRRNYGEQFGQIGAREFENYIHVDKAGTNMGLLGGDELVFDVDQFNEDLALQRRISGSVSMMYQGDRKTVAENVAYQMERDGVRGRGPLGMLTDRQIGNLERDLMRRMPDFFMQRGHAGGRLAADARVRKQMGIDHHHPLTGEQKKEFDRRMAADEAKGRRISDSRGRQIFLRGMLGQTGMFADDELDTMFQTGQGSINLDTTDKKKVGEFLSQQSITMDVRHDMIVNAHKETLRKGGRIDTDEKFEQYFSEMSREAKIQRGFLDEFEVSLGSPAELENLTSTQLTGLGNVLSSINMPVYKKERDGVFRVKMPTREDVVNRINKLGLPNNVTENAIQMADNAISGRSAKQRSFAGVTTNKRGIFDGELSSLNTGPVADVGRNLLALGNRMVSDKVGTQIDEALQASGTTYGNYLSSLGVSGSDIRALQQYGNLDIEQQKTLGENILATGLSAEDPRQQMSYFQGLANAGLGGFSQLANAAAGLMSTDKETRRKAAQMIPGVTEADVETALSGDQAAALLRRHGHTDPTQIRLKGTQTGMRGKVGAASFQTAVQSFSAAVSLFASKAGDDPANALIQPEEVGSVKLYPTSEQE